jgi:predicted ester cyclase
MDKSEFTALVHQIYDVFNSRDLSKLDPLFDPGYEDHSSGVPIPTPFDLQALKGLIGMYYTAFPDAHWELADILVEGVADGDRAAWRERFTGTQQGEFMGMPPSGRKVDVAGMSMGEIRNGKAYRHWSVYDNLSMMQQLGVIPTPGA